MPSEGIDTIEANAHHVAPQRSAPFQTSTVDVYFDDESQRQWQKIAQSSYQTCPSGTLFNSSHEHFAHLNFRALFE